MKKYKVGYTTGVFDMFHVGHLNILRRAKDLCEYLIVGVTTDELCYSRKGHYPIVSLKDRMTVVEAIKYVDKVVVQDSMNKLQAYNEYHFNVVFVGDDWKGTDAWIRYEYNFKNVGVDVVYLKHTDGISSTILRSEINAKYKT